MDDISRERWIRKFENQNLGDKQWFQVYTELLIDAYMSSQGFQVEYERNLGSRKIPKTPDWCILSTTSSQTYMTPTCIVEMINFHDTNDQRKELSEALKTDGHYVHWRIPKLEKACRKLDTKAKTYKELITQKKIPYIIAMGAFDITEPIRVYEIKQLLEFEPCNLFSKLAYLSGVIFFQEQTRIDFSQFESSETNLNDFFYNESHRTKNQPFNFDFTFFSNSKALFPFNMPSGTLNPT
jgi:hypothetical protein